MGQGDQFMKPRFSVPMPGKGPWPLDPDKTAPGPRTICAECGAEAVQGAAHLDRRDVGAGRPKKRVCFGKVMAR